VGHEDDDVEGRGSRKIASEILLYKSTGYINIRSC
jgi:hypothetical protein